MTRALLRLASGLVVVALAVSCKKRESGHDHSSEHPEGHDHHAEGHGHGDVGMVLSTHWSERIELFAEHPVAVAGKEVELLAHLTVLDDFRPLQGAALRLELEGPAPLRAEAKSAIRPGIFRFAFVPPKPGKYVGRVVVAGGPVADTVEGFAIEVFENEKEAQGAVPKEEEGRFIELLKEQQWGVPFATAFAKTGTLTASIELAGDVTTPPGGTAEIGAPISGRIVASEKGLPHPGEPVRKGQLLATLAPAPAAPEEAARAKLSVTEGEARLARARSARERAERLIRDQAISERELEDARREAQAAEEALRATRNLERQFSGAAAGSGPGSWRLIAPIDGTLVDVLATPGAAVAPGTLLFRVVDTRELWIRVRVPEQDAARLRTDRDASYRIAGLDLFLPIDITGDDASAALVTLGRQVDKASRTVDLIYSLENADPRLRVGGLVRVSVPAGPDFTGVLIPASAIVDDDGREVLYVQIDGEHFEERTVRTGPRQGGMVGVAHGLSAGERVVVRGAPVVRLAAGSGSEQPHGHVH